MKNKFDAFGDLLCFKCDNHIHWFSPYHKVNVLYFCEKCYGENYEIQKGIA